MMLSEPFWILIFDAALGVMQWLLLLRFAYGIFLPENTRIFGIIHNNKVTDPVIKSFGFLTPDWLIGRVRPLYVAFYFLIARFYILPTIIGYDVYGLVDLSIEALLFVLLDSLS
ncbi:MAG: hypothetical protein ACON4G_00960 [Candidatus Puniceispirillaceae bacterium]